MRYLIGLGNYTAGDDAVGVLVVEYVVANGLDRDIVVLDLGANALNLVAYLGPDVEAMLVIDAAYLGLEPGEYCIFSPDDVETQKALAGLSTHEGDVLRVLNLAASAGYPIPPTAVMGIEPGEMTSGIGLSEPLAERLPAYAAAAVERLLQL